jgi:hypothetical protein
VIKSRFLHFQSFPFLFSREKKIQVSAAEVALVQSRSMSADVKNAGKIPFIFSLVFGQKWDSAQSGSPVSL